MFEIDSEIDIKINKHLENLLNMLEVLQTVAHNLELFH